MNKRFLITVITLVVIAVAAIIVVFLAKGYTFSVKDGKLVGTGIIALTSIPDGALVYIDGHLTTATNTTLSQLQPKNYIIKIVKEGFTPWTKSIGVREGMVSEVKAILFPALPTIYPLTQNGVVGMKVSPDGQKLAFNVPFNPDLHTRQKGGVWVWTMGAIPISLSRGAEPHQLVVSSSTLDFSNADLSWSPDSKFLLVKIYEGKSQTPAAERTFLLPFDKQTNPGDLRDITPIVAGTIKEWEDDQKTRNEDRLATISDLKVKEIASSSVFLSWAPDETKFIAGNSLPLTADRLSQIAESNKPEAKSLRKDFKVYDVVMNVSYNLPEALNYLWLGDSRHIVLVQSDKVSIAEFDGSNVAEIFAGKFEGIDIIPWPDSSRLVLRTSFNTQTGSAPNLFGINLK